MEQMFAELLSIFPNVVSKLEFLYKDFTAFTKVNPVVGGMLGLWLLGTATYVFKTIPYRLLNSVKRYTTVVATLSSANQSFYHMLEWLDKQGKSKNSRTIRVSDGVWGYDSANVSLGLGDHYIRLGFRFYKIKRAILSADGGNKPKEELHIITYGFSQKPLLKLIKESSPKQKIARNIYTFDDGKWSFNQEMHSRRIETILLKKGQKERIIEFLKDFDREKQWYDKHDVAYKTGMIFNGPPGTGKTSLVKAMSSHLGKDLCVLSCEGLIGSKFKIAINSLPKNSILLLEDFDSIQSTKSREFKDDGRFYMGISLSELLNAIDGVFNSDGRIIIATTNTLETIDAALIRPGRFDSIERLGYVDEDIVLRFFDRFFPKHTIKSVQVAENISASQIENCFLQHKTDYDKVLLSIEKLVPLKNVVKGTAYVENINEEETMEEDVVYER